MLEIEYLIALTMFINIYKQFLWYLTYINYDK